MALFRTPHRRNTRQHSGFKVSGQGTGSTCKIEKSTLIEPKQGKIVIQSKLPLLKAPNLFRRNIAVVGFGFYVYPAARCYFKNFTLSFKYKESPLLLGRLRITLSKNLWLKYGVLHEISCSSKLAVLRDISVNIVFETQKPINLFGLMIGAVRHPYLEQNDVYAAFKEKSTIYLPEILFLDPTTESSQFKVVQGKVLGEGEHIVCKSCNRCSRFLPIDIGNEKNTLSYSNHCVSRAPCTHSAFSSYEIKGGDKRLISSGISGNVLKCHYGHQLECKVCKKFFVNLPLNPLRDSTQHREDSLRRRALEPLIAKLLHKKWIYHVYRIKKATGLDVAIWKKFGRKCFKCGKQLKKPNDMDLDHTLPLAYLWPLDDTATCLCKTCNSGKSDKFPVDFYNAKKLRELAKLTGIPIAKLQSRPINERVVQSLFRQIAWFFDKFLADKEYQKLRRGKKASDLMVHALHNVLNASGYDVDLVQLYKSKTSRLPRTVSIK